MRQQGDGSCIPHGARTTSPRAGRSRPAPAPQGPCTPLVGGGGIRGSRASTVCVPLSAADALVPTKDICLDLMRYARTTGLGSFCATVAQRRVRSPSCQPPPLTRPRTRRLKRGPVCDLRVAVTSCTLTSPAARSGGRLMRCVRAVVVKPWRVPRAPKSVRMTWPVRCTSTFSGFRSGARGYSECQCAAARKRVPGAAPR